MNVRREESLRDPRTSDDWSTSTSRPGHESDLRTATRPVRLANAYCKLWPQGSRYELLLALPAVRPRSAPKRVVKPTRRAHRLSAAHKAALADAYASGTSVNDLAARYGVDRTTICAALDAAGLSRPPQRLTEAEITQAVELYGQGLSIDAVGAVLGRAAQTVQKALRSAGVAIRDTRGRPRS